MILLSGYRFGMNRITATKVHWRCSMNRRCHAVVHTMRNKRTIVKCHNIHHHPTYISKVENTEVSKVDLATNVYNVIDPLTSE